jgi:hypothetical protein
MTSLIITLIEKVRPAVECEEKAHPFIVQLPVPIHFGSNKPCHCSCKNVAIPKKTSEMFGCGNEKEKRRGERKKKWEA